MIFSFKNQFILKYLNNNDRFHFISVELNERALNEIFF
jgi:hypothetical protein